NTFRWGEHRGGMFVEIAGTALDGTPLRRSWHMIAEGDAGPLIPSMAAEAIIRKVLAGDVPKSGARRALEELSLDDYARLFARHAIRFGVRESSPAHEAARDALPLFQRVLGAAWHE